MTLEGFSNGFDTLLNSYMQAASFGKGASAVDVVLDEYEKSLHLTRAQDNIVLSLYKGNNPDEGFEYTEELRRYLAPLIKEARLSPDENITGVLGVDSNSKFFTLPEDVWFITYESVIISDGKCEGVNRLDVVPVRQDEYSKIRKNPFRGASDRRALRFDLADGVIEILSTKIVTSYYVRYLSQLKPIVLADFTSDNLTIQGVSEPTPCELPENLHYRILELAVQYALASKRLLNNENQ